MAELENQEPIIKEPDFWGKLLDEFLAIYPEFEPLFEGEGAEKMKARFKTLFHKISCLYPEFSDLKSCKNKLPYFMLVAHNAVIAGLGTPLGILAQNGLVASSSVGGVSVSYQGSPYANADEFGYFMSLTPYGKEYLAWLARQAGLSYVN